MTSSFNPSLGRVVANVVELQGQLVNQFDYVVHSLEALKNAHVQSINVLRLDIQRFEDRSKAQADELRIAREKNDQRQHEVITQLLNMLAQKGAANATSTVVRNDKFKSDVDCIISAGDVIDSTQTSTVPDVRTVHVFAQTEKSSESAKPKTEPVGVPKTDQKQNEVEEADDEPDNYEPQVDFKPVIPLPELVNVVTGEEGEEVVFESRCKLYRFAESKAWKEHGTGIIKILKNTDTAKIRVVMRREEIVWVQNDGAWHAQVHKICANHPLVAGMNIFKMPKNEKALAWICKDFTDDVGQMEHFSVKFASVELADQFKSAFEGSIPLEDSKKDTSASDTVPAVISTSSVPVVTQIPDDNKPSESAKPQCFDDKFKMKNEEWECTGCYTRQSAEKIQCDCCFTNKDGTQGEKNIFKPMAAPAPGARKFSFGFAAAVAARNDVAPVTPEAGIFGSQAISTAPKFSIGTAGSPSTSIFGGNKPSTEQSAAASNSTTSTSVASPVTVSFNSATSTPTRLFGGKNIFRQSALGSGEKKAETETIPKSDSEPAKVFGSGFASGLSFNSVAKSNASIFGAENTEKAKVEFANLPKSKLAAPIKKDEAAEGDDEGDDEDDVEKEPDVEFAPVVPLPDLVEVVTGEEREEVVFKERAKLFQFDRELGQNKERGTGYIKILRNPDTGKYRVVMRREQVHKLCANFHITSDLKISPKPNMPNVYMWSCMDYAEVEGGSYETLTVKFKNEEIAKQFHDEFVNAQK